MVEGTRCPTTRVPHMARLTRHAIKKMTSQKNLRLKRRRFNASDITWSPIIISSLTAQLSVDSPRGPTIDDAIPEKVITMMPRWPLQVGGCELLLLTCSRLFQKA